MKKSLPFNFEFQLIIWTILDKLHYIRMFHFKNFCSIDFDQVVQILQSRGSSRTGQGHFFHSEGQGNVLATRQTKTPFLALSFPLQNNGMNLSSHLVKIKTSVLVLGQELDRNCEGWKSGGGGGGGTHARSTLTTLLNCWSNSRHFRKHTLLQNSYFCPKYNFSEKLHGS